jgi:hypothetical protein
MRVLIINTDYPGFLKSLYGSRPELASSPYSEQMAARNASLFGVFDSYSRNLRALGHAAVDIHANNEAMQRRWARDAGMRMDGGRPFRAVRELATRLPYIGGRFRRRPSQEPWFQEILAAQIEDFCPDVILNQDVYMVSAAFLAGCAPTQCLIAGQLASPLPKRNDWDSYDLMLSSLPNLVSHFEAIGVPAQFCPLGFEASVHKLVPPGAERDIPLLFVGSFSAEHRARIELLEYLCTRVPLEIWGSGLSSLERHSPIRRHVKGEAWGADMYRLLARARIALNQHIDMAGNFANNCRLFEATGMGAMLLTDRKQNLDRYFQLGVEAVDYGSAEECRDKVHAYLDDPTRLDDIAKAGMRRTLADHNYAANMAKLAGILEDRRAGKCARKQK